MLMKSGKSALFQQLCCGHGGHGGHCRHGNGRHSDVLKDGLCYQRVGRFVLAEGTKDHLAHVPAGVTSHSQQRLDVFFSVNRKESKLMPGNVASPCAVMTPAAVFVRDPCGLPDVRILGHQRGDLQEEECGVSQLKHLCDSSDGTAQLFCVFTLHIEIFISNGAFKVIVIMLPCREIILCVLTSASFLKRNLNWSASLIILSAPSFLSSAFLNVIFFCITALMYSTTTRRKASFVMSC